MYVNVKQKLLCSLLRVGHLPVSAPCIWLFYGRRDGRTERFETVHDHPADRKKNSFLALKKKHSILQKTQQSIVHKENCIFLFLRPANDPGGKPVSALWKILGNPAGAEGRSGNGGGKVNAIRLQIKEQNRTANGLERVLSRWAHKSWLLADNWTWRLMSRDPATDWRARWAKKIDRNMSDLLPQIVCKIRWAKEHEDGGRVG